MSIPLNIDWQQILLHLFNFAILAGGLYLLLYRPVKQFMEQRQAYYESLHREAEEAREQAAQVKDACRAKLAETDAAIAQKRAEAEQELDELRARQIAGTKQEAKAILDKARDSVRRERDDLLNRAAKELMDATASAAEKITLGAEDPYEPFLRLAERRAVHEQSQ